MKTFQVFRHPIRGHEAVKVGFSWPAFFWGLFGLSVVWLVIKRLWKLTGIWIGAYLAVVAVDAAIALLIVLLTETPQVVYETTKVVPDWYVLFSYILYAVAYVVLWLLPAFKGNGWRISSLERRGYELVGQFEAPSPDAALAQAASSS